MSSSANGPSGQWPPPRRSKRNTQRNGTFIVAATGERVHRTFTLRQPPNMPRTAGDGSDDPADASASASASATAAAAMPPPFFSLASASERLQTARHKLAAATYRAFDWLDSPPGRGVLKCTLAYTLASLWTFWEPLSDVLGKPDGKHVVATITVYFHPARSFGSMIEAVLVAIVAVGYAELVSVLSMCVSVLFGGVLGRVTLAHALVLLLFIGGGFGFIGWVKQRMNNPLVNVGGTLASLAIIGAVTRETAVFTNVFSNEKIRQLFLMLVFGITTTTAVNLLVWRVSAVASLRGSMTKASTALSSMLAMITSDFLAGAEESMASPQFNAASAAYSSIHPQLAKNLRESKFERYLLGHETVYQLDRAVVRSIETLAQSIGGLRSAANTQFALLRESAATALPSGQVSPTSVFHRPPLARSPSSVIRVGRDRLLALSAIDETLEGGSNNGNANANANANVNAGREEEEGGGGGGGGGAAAAAAGGGRRNSNASTNNSISNGNSNSNNLATMLRTNSMSSLSDIGLGTPVAPPSLRTPSDIFEFFIALLGPSMKALAFTASEILREHPFGAAPGSGRGGEMQVQVNEQFRHSLGDALALFNEARARALRELYRLLELRGAPRSAQAQADFEEVAAACGHFSFSLQTFCEEMRKYLDVLDDLKYADEHRVRSWGWAAWWRRGWGKGGKGKGMGTGMGTGTGAGTASARRWTTQSGSNGGINRSASRQASVISALPYSMHAREEDRDGEGDGEEGADPAAAAVKPIKRSAMPRGIPDAMIERRDTFSWEATPSASRVLQTLSRRLLRMIRKLARDDIRFGLKVGIGATLWAMFAFIPETRETYQHWRGEWGLLSFMIVCSMTVGAANTTGWSRFIGSLIGALWSVINWNATQGNAAGLLVLGWLVAFWSFWMITAHGRIALGRTTLLAYNISTLYAYSLSQHVEDPDDDEGGVHPIIRDIVVHRTISVTIGIVWGLIVCRLIWPISARRKFREGLSVLYLQMGLIWKRGPLAILLRSHSSRSYLRSGEQAALQKYANRLDALRVAAASEFELRGPFPAEPFARAMRATSRILDAFYAMSLVTQRRGHQLTEGERALLLFTAEERALLCSRICQLFQVLASSLMLEYPLTDASPTIAGTRDRLLGKIFLFRKEHQRRARQLSKSRQGQGQSQQEGVVAAGDDERDREREEEEAERERSSTDHLLSQPQPQPQPQQYQQGSSWIEGTDGDGGVLGDIVMPVAVEERDYALLYAYALVTGQVAEELKLLQREVEGLYGVLDENLLLLQ